MNCDCLTERCEKLKKDLPKRNQAYARLEIISVFIDGESLVYNDGKLEVGLSIPLTVTHKPIGRKKTTAVKLLASYCPFCGMPTKQNKNKLEGGAEND